MHSNPLVNPHWKEEELNFLVDNYNNYMSWKLLATALSKRFGITRSAYACKRKYHKRLQQMARQQAHLQQQSLQPMAAAGLLADQMIDEIAPDPTHEMAASDGMRDDDDDDDDDDDGALHYAANSKQQVGTGAGSSRASTSDTGAIQVQCTVDLIIKALVALPNLPQYQTIEQFRALALATQPGRDLFMEFATRLTEQLADRSVSLPVHQIYTYALKGYILAAETCGIGEPQGQPQSFQELTDAIFSTKSPGTSNTLDSQLPTTEQLRNRHLSFERETLAFGPLAITKEEMYARQPSGPADQAGWIPTQAGTNAPLFELIPNYEHAHFKSGDVNDPTVLKLPVEGGRNALVILAQSGAGKTALVHRSNEKVNGLISFNFQPKEVTPGSLVSLLTSSLFTKDETFKHRTGTFKVPQSLLLYNRVCKLLLVYLMILLRTSQKNKDTMTLQDGLRLQSNGFLQTVEVVFKALETQFRLMDPEEFIRDAMRELQGMFLSGPFSAFTSAFLDEASFCASLFPDSALASNGTLSGALPLFLAMLEKFEFNNILLASTSSQLVLAQTLQSQLGKYNLRYVVNIMTIPTRSTLAESKHLAHAVHKTFNVEKQALVTAFACHEAKCPVRPRSLDFLGKVVFSDKKKHELANASQLQKAQYLSVCFGQAYNCMTLQILGHIVGRQNDNEFWSLAGPSKQLYQSLGFELQAKLSSSDMKVVRKLLLACQLFLFADDETEKDQLRKILVPVFDPETSKLVSIGITGFELEEEGKTALTKDTKIYARCDEPLAHDVLQLIKTLVFEYGDGSFISDLALAVDIENSKQFASLLLELPAHLFAGVARIVIAHSVRLNGSQDVAERILVDRLDQNEVLYACSYEDIITSLNEKGADGQRLYAAFLEHIQHALHSVTK